MRRNTLILMLLVPVAALVVGLIMGRLLFSPKADPVPMADSGPAAPTVWTCSMHPQIQTTEPGDCPICGMDLIPLESNGGDDLGPRAMSMSESAMILAEVQTTVVKRAYPVANINLVGRLEFDETRMKSLTARFPARIDRLFVNYTGAPVQKSEHLAMIYSPELSAAQHELLMGIASDPEGRLALAAREKLRLWDLLPEQIEAIVERGEPVDQFELRAPIGGIVVEKHVNEGDYVQMGQPLFKIADLGKLWLILDAYESDLPWLKYGQEVSFTVQAFPGEVFSGRITFINPEMDRRTRTVAVRVHVENADGRLKPGMFAKGRVQSQVAGGGEVYAPDMAGKWISPMHPEIVKDGPGQCDVCGMDLVPAESLGFVTSITGEAPLVVPSSAVLRTGKRGIVYVQLDRPEPTFEGREVVLGPLADDVFIVRSGLQEGERVVSRGAFKIDSALQIMAKPSMMNPVEEPQEDPAMAAGQLTIEVSTAREILPEYFSLQQAMASDDLERSRKSLMAMMAKTGHTGALPDLIYTMLAADSMDGLRRPHFETLSNALIAAVKSEPSAFEGSIYRMNCSMVYDDRGADWLQDNGELFNPYWGEVMRRCGTVEEQIR
jgi:Cu(I)/Ag(I) efflux system membrane fusion protein